MMTKRTRLPDAFQLLVPNDNFPLKNAKFDLFGSENASWKVETLVVNRDWLIE